MSQRQVDIKILYKAYFKKIPHFLRNISIYYWFDFILFYKPWVEFFYGTYLLAYVYFILERKSIFKNKRQENRIEKL
jgi:hypothetical protein